LTIALEYRPFGKLWTKHIYLHGKRVATETGSDAIATATTVSAAPASPVLGQPVTLTAMVSPAAATGTVSFIENGVTLGVGTVASGSASIVATALAVGSHSITAEYSGDYTYLGSSGIVAFSVAKRSATVDIAGAPATALAGARVTLSSTVSGSAPTGQVEFRDGGQILGTAALVNGTASFLTPPLSPGMRSFTASYPGDGNHEPATSAAMSTSVAIVSQPALFRDFGGDGRSDVLWRRTDGFLYQWFMDGSAISGTGSPGTLTTDWVVEAMGDISGDGKADLVRRNTTTGELSIWALDGASVVDSHSYIVPDLAWQVAGVDDMDGDGKGDLVWRHATTGDLSVWIMAGIHAATGHGLGNVAPAWTLAATGDLDGDGRGDLLWRHSAGGMAIWYSSGFPGFTSVDFGYLDPAWEVAGLGDYNIDTALDIVWRHATGGDVYLWLMGPGGTWQGAAFGTVPLDWAIAGVGDYDGDGRSDLLWRQASTGAVYLWRFTSPSTMTGQDIGPVGGEWTIVNP